MAGILGSETARNLLISIFVFVALAAFSFFFFTSGFEPLRTFEEPLSKNSAFYMRPGDSLSYSYNSSGENGTISFLFGSRPGNGSIYGAIANPDLKCVFVLMQGANATTCVSADGRDAPANRSLSQPFFFHSPWMLGLSNNFTWASEDSNSLTGEAVNSFSASVSGSALVFGRDAFMVKISDSSLAGNVKSVAYVDKKSRILLKQEWQNGSLQIIQAPFPLQQ